MFFYLDESGNTNMNLFDSEQPLLIYGLLCSKTNIDEDATIAKKVECIRNKINVKHLHGKELKEYKISKIVDDIVDLYNDYEIKIDFYLVNKVEYGIIYFYDQLFDPWNNKGASRLTYITPTKYLLLLKFFTLFDKDLAKQTWSTILMRGDQAINNMQLICKELIFRLTSSKLDNRSKELISSSLQYCIKNTDELVLVLGNLDKNTRKLYSPNIIIFPFTLAGIGRRKNKFNEGSLITIDNQVKFNESQKEMFEKIKNMEGKEFQLGPYLSIQNFDKLPSSEIVFKSEDTSIGLELLDIVLWIFHRYKLGKLKNMSIFEKLSKFFEYYDELSYDSIKSKWDEFDKKVPQLEDFSKEQLEKALNLIEKDRNETQSRMKGS